MPPLLALTDFRYFTRQPPVIFTVQGLKTLKSKNEVIKMINSIHDVWHIVSPARFQSIQERSIRVRDQGHPKQSAIPVFLKAFSFRLQNLKLTVI